MWARWRCKRCCSNIPAGLQGKYRQAVAAKSGEWSTGSSTSSGEEDRKTRSLEAENKELRARIDALEMKEGVQGGPSILSREGGESEGVWRESVEVEDEAESRRKLDEQTKKLHKEVRDVDRPSFVSKEMQESIMESLQWRKGCLSTRSFKKRSQKIQCIQDKSKHMQKENAAAEEEVRKLRDEVKQKEERILFLSDKVEKNKMADADMAAENFRGCRHEKKEGAAMLRRQEIAAWRPYGSKLLPCCAAVGPIQIDALAIAGVQRFKESGAVQEQVPGRDERRRSSEEEHEQGGASQQVALPTPGGFIQGAPASRLELDLLLARGVPGEGGSAGRSGTQGHRKRGPFEVQV